MTAGAIRNLIQLAEDAIAAHARGDEVDTVIARLEAYGEGFEAWHSDSASVGAVSKETLLQLEPLHQQVLQLAVSLQDSTGGELKELSRRGKGLRRYIDQLPRSISRIMSKKG